MKERGSCVGNGWRTDLRVDGKDVAPADIITDVHRRVWPGLVPRGLQFRRMDQRQRGKLGHVALLQLRRGIFRGQVDEVAARKAVAEVRADKPGHVALAGVERPQEEAGGVELVFVGRFLKQLQPFLVGGVFVGPLTEEQQDGVDRYLAWCEEQDAEYERELRYGKPRCPECGHFTLSRATVSTGYDR